MVPDAKTRSKIALSPSKTLSKSIPSKYFPEILTSNVLFVLALFGGKDFLLDHDVGVFWLVVRVFACGAVTVAIQQARSGEWRRRWSMIQWPLLFAASLLLFVQQVSLFVALYRLPAIKVILFAQFSGLSLEYFSSTTSGLKPVAAALAVLVGVTSDRSWHASTGYGALVAHAVVSMTLDNVRGMLYPALDINFTLAASVLGSSIFATLFYLLRWILHDPAPAPTIPYASYAIIPFLSYSLLFLTPRTLRSMSQLFLSANHFLVSYPVSFAVGGVLGFLAFKQGPRWSDLPVAALLYYALYLRQTDGSDGPTRTSASRLVRSYVKTILSNPESRKIFYFLVLNMCYMLVQMLYGVWTNSLGLISDAIHMAFDCMAIGVGLLASVMATWEPNERFTYGYGRIETLSGFANGIFLILISIFIVFEAIGRLIEPPEMNTSQLLLVSSLGLAVNLFGMFAMGGHHHGHSHGHDHGHDHSHDEQSHEHAHSHDRGHDHNGAHSHTVDNHHNHDHPHEHDHGQLRKQEYTPARPFPRSPLGTDHNHVHEHTHTSSLSISQSHLEHPQSPLRRQLGNGHARSFSSFPALCHSVSEPFSLSEDLPPSRHSHENGHAQGTPAVHTTHDEACDRPANEDGHQHDHVPNGNACEGHDHDHVHDGHKHDEHDHEHQQSHSDDFVYDCDHAHEHLHTVNGVEGLEHPENHAQSSMTPNNKSPQGSGRKRQFSGAPLKMKANHFRAPSRHLPFPSVTPASYLLESDSPMTPSYQFVNDPHLEKHHDGHQHSHASTHEGHSHNMRGVFLHVMADTLGSVGVIISTILIQLYGWTGFDPIASLFIAVMIAASVIPLVIDTGKVLCLDVADRSTAIQEALDELSLIEGLASYSAPRFWPKDSTSIIGSIHIQLLPSAASYDPAGPHGVQRVTYAQVDRVVLRVKEFLTLRIPGLEELTIQVEESHPSSH